MALEAGSVFVKLAGLFVRDEFDKWDRAVDSERAKARTPIDVKLGADSSPLDRKLSESRGKLSAWSGQEADAKVGLDENFLTRSIAAAENRLRAWEAVGHGSVKIDVDLDTTAAEAKLAALKAEAAALKSAMPTGGSRLGPMQGTSQPWFSVPGTPSPLPRDPNTGRFLSPGTAQGRAAMPWWLGGTPRGGFVPPPAASPARMSAADEAFIRAAIDKSMRASLGGLGGGGGGGGGDGGGGGGGGGGADSGGGFLDASGRWLFGAGVTPRRGRFLGRFSPFQMGIHGPLGAVGGAVGLGPEHLLGAAAAIGGSAAGGLAGAGVTALGAAGTMAVGSGSDLAVVKSTIADTKTLTQQYENLDAVIARYGANSSQAKIAQFQLNQAMDQMGGRNGVGVKAEAQLAKMSIALNTQWDKATQHARVQAVNLLEQFVGLGKSYVPRVAAAAEQNLKIINEHIKPLFDWLKGPSGVKIWNDLENQFKRNLPSAVDAFVQGVEFLLKVMDTASKYTGGFTQKLDQIATRWNHMDPKQLSAKIAKLHADFKLWEDTIVNLGKDLALLFKAGSGEGNTLVQMFDNLLKRWGAWERSARGQTALHTFFKQREQELIAILHLVGDVVKIFGSFWAAFQPLVPAVTAFANEIASGLSALIKHVVTPIAGALRWVLSGLVEIGKQSSIFRDAFIIPFGVFLVAWRLFGRDSATQLFNLRSHLEVVGRLLTGMRAATVAIFAGEGVGGAWERLKAAMRPSSTGSPAASMEEGIVAGSKTGAMLIQEAIIAGHKEGAALIEAGEIAGGKVAGAEISTAEALGGAAGGAGQLALFGKQFGGKAVAGEQLSLLGADAAGLGVAGAAAAKGGLFSRLAGMKGGLGGGLLIGLGGGVGTQLLGNAIGGNAGRQVSGYGSSVATGAGIGFTLGGPVGALAGGGIGALAHLAGQVGGTGPNFNAAQTTRMLQQGGADAGARLQSGFSSVGGLSGNRSLQNVLKQWQQEITRLGNGSKTSSAHLRDLAYEGDALAKLFPKSAAAINQVVRSLRSVEAAKNAWNTAFNRAWIAVHDFSVKGGESIKNIKDRFDTNMRAIQATIGLHSAAGRKLANSNFDQMVTHIERSMRNGRISVDSGIKFMQRVADRGTDGMKQDLAGHYKDIVGIIRDSWKHGKTNTQTALKDLRLVISDANKQSRADIVTHYKQLLQDNYNQWKSGNETAADAAKKRSAIHRQMARDLQETQIRLTGSLAHILDGTNTATAAGVDKLFGVLNDALKKLNVTTIKWGVSNVGNVVQSSLGSIFKGVASFGGQASIPSGVPTASNLQAAGFYGGGTLPGAEYGHDDVMTLVDPSGRPRARMAGDEGVLTRHQMPVIDYALNVAKAVGAVPYGSLDEVWGNVTRPHGYQRGGKLPAFAGGGNVWEVRVSQEASSSGGGWTELSPNGNAAARLGIAHSFSNNPAHYPDFASLGKMYPRGTMMKIRANGRAGTWPMTDVGDGSSFAPAIGMTPAVSGFFGGLPALAQITMADGSDIHPYPGMARLVAGTGGFAAAGAGPAGGAGGAQWQNITAPHLTGNAGPLAAMGNGVLKLVGDGVNKYGRAHTPISTGGPGGYGPYGFPGAAPILSSDPQTVQTMIREADMIASHNYPYLWGGGHNSSFSGPYDCSGAVSAVLHSAGLLSSSEVSGQMMSYGDAGPGKYVTLYASPSHVFMSLDGHYFGTSGMNPGGGANWIPHFPEPMPAIRHPRGLATGGLIGSVPYRGRFTAGNESARMNPTHTKWYKKLPANEQERLRKNPYAILPGMASGGRLSNLVPNFARGGKHHKKPSYSLYTPPKPPGRIKKPKVFHAHLPPSVSKYIGIVPGAKQFAQDDADIARLEDRYNRQEAIFNLYDAGGGQLPGDDLDQLYSIRLQEWNILQKEWLSLPGFLEQIKQRISGHWEGHWDTGSHWRWVGHGKHRHRVPIASIGSPRHSRHPVYHRDRYAPGLQADVARLQHTLDADDKEISHLNNKLYKEHVRELKQKKAYTDQAYKIANSIASKVAKILDQIYGNLDAAHNISDEISAIKTASPAESLQGLTGPAYAAGQQNNISIKAANHARTVRRHTLSRERQRIMDKNTHLHKEIRHLENEKSAAARRLHHQGFTVAWTYELDRLAIGQQIRHIRESMKELRDKLKEETKLLNQYTAAETAAEARLYGATAEDPTATGLRGTMGDIGMDILNLQQEGAAVPKDVIANIVAILTGDSTTKPPKGLGLKLPPGFASLTSGGQTAAQALSDFLSFQATRQNIFAQFGSNFVAAGTNPYPGNAGLAAGMQYYGAAAGAASGAAYGPATGMGGGNASLAGGSGGAATTINITQNFASGPPDPHTYAAGLGFEIGARM